MRRRGGGECNADGGRGEGAEDENATRMADDAKAWRRRMQRGWRTRHGASLQAGRVMPQKTTPPCVGTQRRGGGEGYGESTKNSRQVFESRTASRRPRRTVMKVAARGKCKRPVLCWPSQHGAFVICQLDFCRWNGPFFVFLHRLFILFHFGS